MWYNMPDYANICILFGNISQEKLIMKRKENDLKAGFTMRSKVGDIISSNKRRFCVRSYPRNSLKRM